MEEGRADNAAGRDCGCACASSDLGQAAFSLPQASSSSSQGESGCYLPAFGEEEGYLDEVLCRGLPCQQRQVFLLSVCIATASCLLWVASGAGFALPLIFSELWGNACGQLVLWLWQDFRSCLQSTFLRTRLDVRSPSCCKLPLSEKRSYCVPSR